MPVEQCYELFNKVNFLLKNDVFLNLAYFIKDIYNKILILIKI